MRLIKTIVFLTLLTYSVMFCVFNFQSTSLAIPFVTKIESLPLFLVIIGFLVVGILIGSMIGTAKEFRGYIKENSVHKENKNLKKKIDLFETEQKIQDRLRLEELENE